MAKTKSAAVPASDEEWRVRDAMQTLLRAGEIVGDKKLLEKVRKMAAEHAEEMKDVSRQAAVLAKKGRISPKALEKLAR